MTIKSRIQFTIEYIAVVAMAVLVYLFIDGDMGMLFAAVLLLVPVYSVICVLVARKPFSAVIELSDSVLNKGDEIEAVIRISGTGRTMPPFVCVDIVTDGRLGAVKETYVLPMFLKKEASLSLKLTARYCGGSQIRADNIAVCGLFGVIKFGTRSLPCVKAVSVYPDSLQLPANDLLLTQANAASTFDDSEETTESKPAFTGVPGYEHREYNEGDSLKRVNWKLSAKREKLFVRLDESIAKSRINLILADCCTENDELSDMASECVQAFADRLCELDNRCIFEYFDRANGAWDSINVETHDDTQTLRTALSGIHSAENAQCAAAIPINTELSKKAVAMVIIFAAVYNESVEAAAAEYERGGYETAVVAAAAEITAARKVWIISRADGVVSLD